jgi:hypothetical protein
MKKKTFIRALFLLGSVFFFASHNQAEAFTANAYSYDAETTPQFFNIVPCPSCASTTNAPVGGVSPSAGGTTAPAVSTTQSAPSVAPCSLDTSIAADNARHGRHHKRHRGGVSNFMEQILKFLLQLINQLLQLLGRGQINQPESAPEASNPMTTGAVTDPNPCDNPPPSVSKTLPQAVTTPSVTIPVSQALAPSGPLLAETPPVSAAAGKKWQLMFDEEFNGTDYDHTKLTPCFDWNTGDCTSTFNSGYEHYLPSQVRVSGGIGHLVAEPLSPPYANSACYQGSCIYKSGLLSTARPNASTGTNYLYKFTYGYAEASLRAVNQQGFFVAFWTLPAHPAESGYETEIDILEQLGNDPSDMEMHYHYGGRNTTYTPNGTGGKNGACPVKDYSTGLHRFGVDWEPTSIAFYIDGVKCGQFTGAAGSVISSEPHQLILDQMVSNNWERSINKPLLNNSLTNDLQVDYIRVFQQVPSN